MISLKDAVRAVSVVWAIVCSTSSARRERPAGAVLAVAVSMAVSAGSERATNKASKGVCPNNALSTGSCINGLCAIGYTCISGTCCATSIGALIALFTIWHSFL